MWTEIHAALDIVNHVLALKRVHGVAAMSGKVFANTFLVTWVRDLWSRHVLVVGAW